MYRALNKLVVGIVTMSAVLGLALSAPRADETVASNDGQGGLKVYKITQEKIDLEVGYICPSSGGNSTVQANCSDEFAACREHTTNYIINAVKNIYQCEEITSNNEVAYRCTPEQYQKLLDYYDYLRTPKWNPGFEALVCKTLASTYMCGNGKVEGVEQCDQGVLGTAECTASCHKPPVQGQFPDAGIDLTCGNGKQDHKDEECDDGNQANNDGCNDKCKIVPIVLSAIFPEDANTQSPTQVGEKNDDANGFVGSGGTNVPTNRVSPELSSTGGCSLNAGTELTPMFGWLALFAAGAIPLVRKRK